MYEPRQVVVRKVLLRMGVEGTPGPGNERSPEHGGWQVRPREAKTAEHLHADLGVHIESMVQD